MTDPESVNARIEALEVRAAYQDKVIEDLNQTVIDQWKKLDALRRQLDEVLDRVQEVEGGGPRSPEPPPPHY